MLLSGKSALGKSLYLVTSGNGTRLAIDGESIIRQSAASSSATGLVATDSTGVKSSQVYEIGMSTVQGAAVIADVWARLEWEIVAASAGAPQGRLNFDVRRSGVVIPSVTKALGPARSLAAAVGTRYVDLLHVRLPVTTFSLGDLLSLAIEFEVTTASGSGGSTVNLQLNHDPATANREAIVEVNV